MIKDCFYTSAKAFLEPGVMKLRHWETKLHRELGKDSAFLRNFKNTPVALGSYGVNQQLKKM